MEGEGDELLELMEGAEAEAAGVQLMLREVAQVAKRLVEEEEVVVILAPWLVEVAAEGLAQWEQHEVFWEEDWVAIAGLLLEGEGEVVEREQDCGLEEQAVRRPSVPPGKEEGLRI